MGKTISEKILSRHSGRDLNAGDLALCDIDFCLSQDGTSAIAIDSFKDLGAKKIFNPKKYAMIIDHNSPAPNAGVAAIHAKMRQFAKAQRIKLFDIGEGVCHQLVPEFGFVLPGDLVIGADSHTCTYGALGVFATGVGSTDLAVALATGKNWFKVPHTMKITLNGKLPKGVYSKDIILKIIGDIKNDGANYMAMEFYGKTISDLSMDSRFTITNMVIEAGAKVGLMEQDRKTFEWLKGRSKRKITPIAADKDAKYCREIEFDMSNLRPQIAKPHTVDNTCAIDEVLGTHIDQAFLGTCTNGRLEDLEIAAKILKGRPVNKDVRLIVAPASKSIYLDAVKKGYIQALAESGASIVTPGCGVCVGTHNGVPADNEVVISSSNRNFKGRQGNPNAFIYLASPATVAASSIEGKITDPVKYIK